MSDVLVIGGGLSGALAALALAERGRSVDLLDDRGDGAATGLSYGGVPWWAGASGPLDRLMTTAPQCWSRLEATHGPLGLVPCTLRLHGHAPAHDNDGGSGPTPGADDRALSDALMAVEALARRHLRPDQVERRPLMPPAGAAGVLRLAYARVDSRKLSVALPAALERAGVRLRKGRSAPLRSGSLPADQVVLAAGAGCRGLWPSLPGRLRVSWAGVLALEDPSARHDLLRALGLMDTGDIVMPLLGGRLHLEQQAEVLDRPAWIVDAGLAPRGEGLLLGQTSLVRPGALCGAPPDATRMERRLRQGLATIDPRLARVPARFHQTPVSFVSHGPPLVGPVAGEPGLWIFAGLSSPFALAPPLATLLAAAIDGDRSALENLPGSGSSASSSWT